MLRETFTRAAATHGLTFAEGRALRLVGRDATQLQLTAALGLDKGRVSTILGRLETLGMIERSTGPGDRRIRRVELTADGIAAADGIASYLDTHSPLVRRLDGDQRQAYFALLRQIADR